ncbi:MAG: hypothetical protein HUJ59_01500 [Bacilli bacterium]|nr:hypothetical protein [Bacilli bacterium]
MSTFKVSDKVMHCREGLSEIVSTTEMNGRDYFIVRSFSGDGEAIYVPKDSACNIIRQLMTIEEADNLLNSLKNYQLEYNPNTKQRRDAFKRRINSGDIKDIAYMFYQGYLFKLHPEGIKLGPSDCDMLEHSKKFLFDELMLVYDISKNEIDSFVEQKLKQD